MADATTDVYDITIIGAGPTGLFGAFYAGLRELKVKIIDALPQMGGQLIALYPEKQIFDTPGFFAIRSKELVDHLEKHTDPLEAMLGLHPLDHLQFLQNNLEQFRRAQRLEKAVLSLYFRKNTPFAAAGDYEVWKSLFAECDRERLSAEGKPFPYERVTAYRGSVTDNPKGLSWTVSREEAAWFLSRWQDKSLGGGTVFALDITRQDILVYIEDGKRQEVILKPEVAEMAQPRAIEQL